MQDESTFDNEIAAGKRFGFGANWSQFLGVLNEERISSAEQSLCRMLGLSTLAGLSFLDIGSGSGLFSLAARRLGATVRSFDFDPNSVWCTQDVRQRYFPDDAKWTVESGSILDESYLRRLAPNDIVYSWGVLHHTGNLAAAMTNVVGLVRPGGWLFIALYNDQGWISTYWKVVKYSYVKSPILRPLIILLHAPYLLLGRFCARLVTGRLKQERGMALWYDMVDWIGGWPFEVAEAEDVERFFEAKGFVVRQTRTVGRKHGCNEFVFQKKL